MKPGISEVAFEALVAQTGLPLSPAQKQELHAAYAILESMLARVAGPLPREAEPALIFIPEIR